MALRAQINFWPLVMGRGSQMEWSLEYLGGSNMGTTVSEKGGKMAVCRVQTKLDIVSGRVADKFTAVKSLKNVTMRLAKSTCTLFASKKSRPRIDCHRCEAKSKIHMA